MKALSIRHPSIDVLLLGRRSVEVRRAATRHRGDLLLHASASFGPAERAELDRLRALGLDLTEPGASRRGVLVGVAQLTDCRPMTQADWKEALAEPREGRWWAWRLEAVETFPEPVPCRGHVLMWEVGDLELQSALEAQPGKRRLTDC